MRRLAPALGARRRTGQRTNGPVNEEAAEQAARDEAEDWDLRTMR